MTPAEQDVLASDLAGRELRRTEAVDRPRAIITGGQPGSGKSQITDKLGPGFNDKGGIMVVDPDDVRPRLPYMQKQIDAGNLDIPDVAYSDAGTVAFKIIKIGIEERRNLLIDGTLTNTERAGELVDRLKNAGYDVEVHAMAVYPDQSHARTYDRREAQIAGSPTGFGRGVDDKFHDGAVKGYSKTIETMYEDKLVPKMVLYNATGEVVADSRLRDGAWQGSADVPTTLKSAFEKPSREVLVDASKTWQRAANAMNTRHADVADIAKVEKYALEARQRIEPGQTLTAQPSTQVAASAVAASALRKGDIGEQFVKADEQTRLADPMLRNAQLQLQVGLRIMERETGRSITEIPDATAKLTKAVGEQLSAGKVFEAPQVKPDQGETLSQKITPPTQ